MFKEGCKFFLFRRPLKVWENLVFPSYAFTIGFLFLCSCVEQEKMKKLSDTEVLYSTRIGIFLPVNHKQQDVNKIAIQYFNSAKLAVDDLRPLPIEMLLYETDGTADTMNKELQNAINDNIQIAIGLIDPFETKLLSSNLHNTKLKFITFADKKSGLDFDMFHMGLSRMNLADQIIEYSIDQGYNKFLILESINQEGAIDPTDLKKLIESKNGTIINYLKVSETQDFLSKMQMMISDFNISSQKEAIILLGTPEQNLIFALASLKSSMGKERGERIQVIGLSSWAMERNILSEPAFEGVWFPFVNNQRFGEFSRRYHKLYGSKPTKESVVAYDSIAAIGALIRNAEKLDIPDPFIKSSITNKSGFLGVLGTFRFLENGSSERLLGILESNIDGIQILKKPLDRF